MWCKEGLEYMGTGYYTFNGYMKCTLEIWPLTLHISNLSLIEQLFDKD